MKKLLSLLSVLTISGTAIPTTIAASPYQKEEILNRSKRTPQLGYSQTQKVEQNDKAARNGNELRYYDYDFFSIPKLEFTFTPETWEEILSLYRTSKNSDEFANKFDNKISEIGLFLGKLAYTGYGFNYEIKKSAVCIWNNWTKIGSSLDYERKSRVKITTKMYESSTSFGEHLPAIYISTEIISGENYPNKYVSNWENDFKQNNRASREIQRYVSDIYINLEVIEDNSDSSILNKVKLLYPNLDISQLKIINKSTYSYFNENFSADLVVKDNSNIYPTGFGKILIFNTKTKLNEIKNKILNNNLVKQWIKHINEWKSNLNKLDIDRLKKDNSWLITQKEIAKSYIRDWNIILDLIKNTFKIEELNETVKGIKGDIDSLRNRMNEIENRIENLENSQSNSGLAWCQNVGWGVSVVSGASAFTGIGEVVSIIAGSVAVLCGVIDTLSS